GRSERDAEADVHGAVERFTARSASHDRSDESIPDPERSDHRCFVEFFGEEENQTLQAAAARCTRWHMADAASRHRSGSGIPEMHRMFSLPGCLPRASRPSDARQIYRAALSDSRGGVGDASARYRRSVGGIAKHPGNWLLQHHKVLHQGLPGEHSDYGQRNYSVEGTGGAQVLRSVRTVLALVETATRSTTVKASVRISNSGGGV